MQNIFSNLIIPRINLNSEESLVSAVSLIRDYGFDSFILFATDKVTFGERERFTLNRLSETRKILDSVSEKKVLFFLDAENGLGRRCIDGNEYNYEDAKAVCKAYKAKLANYSQVEKAYNDGGEWCGYGWSDGQIALFPTQKKTYDGLQKIKGHENDCGRPGVIGGYMKNPKMRFGVNCYGKRPKITPEEQKILETSTISIFSSMF